MIVEFFVGMGKMFSDFFAGLTSGMQIPSGISDGMPILQGFLEGASGLGVWVPWAVLSSVIGGLVIFYGFAFGLRLIQKVWGLVPVVGGAG